MGAVVGLGWVWPEDDNLTTFLLGGGGGKEGIYVGSCLCVWLRGNWI